MVMINGEIILSVLFFLYLYGMTDEASEFMIIRIEDVEPKYLLEKYKTLGTGRGEKIFFGLKASQLPN